MSVPDVLPLSPPTTNHRERISIPVAFKPVMTTPNDSPASFTPSSSAANRRKVEFSPWPNLVDPLSCTPSSNMTALKALPPSRDCQTSGRSILKPYTEPVVSITSTDGPGDTHVASPETIEAIAQQLANNNKGSSLDAYQTLSQIIKAYDEIPEDINTRGCIASILRSIRRDLSIQETIQSSPIDTNLMTQALKVSVILVWSGHLSPLLTDDFRVFIIDRCINALAEHTVPKVVIIHYMHLLAVQNFRQSILSSNNRTVKLLEALQDITNHVQGKGAVSERLLIYQKLIEQAKPIMKARASLWIKEVLLGLSSSVKDIRDKAISVGTRACSAFPSSPTVSAAAREALASTVSDPAGNTHTLNTLLTQRLEKMVAAKDEAVQVPQIWALGMLLCSSVDNRVDTWSFLKDWLKVIQRCFNCSDTSVKSQAFPAWNRFIHICRPHDASEILVSMLAKPIVVQIERTSGNTTGKGLRPAAVSSYCMLLYHAFRPAASHKQYTRMWNEYIVKIMGTYFISKSTANADLCSRMLMALMWKNPSSSRVWNENRAHENTLLEPEELPTIDCKWIRSKTEAILQILRLLFKHSYWGPSVQHSDQAYVAKAWRHFLKAIREAGSKEIKPSVETRKSLSLIASFIQEMSEAAARRPLLDDTQGRLQVVCNLAITELGANNFVEAMEADMTLQSPIIIGELLEVAVGSSTMVHNDHMLSKPGNSGTSSLQGLERLLKILDNALGKAYHEYRSGSTHLPLVMKVVCKTLRIVLPTRVLLCLVKLQDSLSAIMEDKRNIVKLQTEASLLSKQWMEFAMVVVDRIMFLHVSCYPQLDDLLAATLLSRNVFTQNMILKAWSEASWSVNQVDYGPKLLKAINLMQETTEIVLPGIAGGRKHSQTHVERNVFINPVVIQEQDTSLTHIVRNNTSPAGNVACDAPTRVDIAAAAEENNQRQNLTKSARRAVRHNDSQVEFVPVDSSPRGADELGSQFLTERQKEIRDRQRTEQVVTFPDLRSSPRPRSTHGSRAPSADCEMARKVAALEKLPSTPTINRQLGAVDEDELPTPTPKARNKTLEVVNVEIPSSPPSVVEHGRPSVGVQDVLSSPPKALNETDADMVDLEDIAFSRDDVIRDLHKANVEAVGDIIAAAGDLPDMHTVTINPSGVVAGATMTSISGDLNLSSTVLETAQEDKMYRPRFGGRLQEAHTSVDNDLTDGTDDIDEPSASQLSQSLSWHVAEEALLSPAHAEPVQGMPNKQKRRKRATNGYADQDRKKRRKHILSNETSLSSMASDDSRLVHENTEAEACITVSTSPPIALGRRQSLANTEADEDHRASFAGSTGKRRSLRHKKTNRIPLHVKSGCSQTTEADHLETSSPADELQSASTEILEESVYTSAARKLTDGYDVQKDITPRVSDTVAPLRHTAEAYEHPTQHEEQVALPPTIDVMIALEIALNELKNVKEGQQANIDLKAIDDLCFKIRYQAQEIARKRE